tara:strand:- start:519 stop:974 length:456 start_codon:yes stop_codon:yes gene_type:complete
MARTFNSVTFPDRLHLAKTPGSGLKKKWWSLGLWTSSDGSNWDLTKDFRAVWTDGEGKKQSYTAKAGLITDMSSVPWFFQGLPGMQKAGKKVFASIIHDDIYERRGLPEGWTREEADLFLFHGWRASGVVWATAKSGYRAVRLGGGKAWRT